MTPCTCLTYGTALDSSGPLLETAPVTGMVAHAFRYASWCLTPRSRERPCRYRRQGVISLGNHS